MTAASRRTSLFSPNYDYGACTIQTDKAPVDYWQQLHAFMMQIPIVMFLLTHVSYQLTSAITFVASASAVNTGAEKKTLFACALDKLLCY